jgi:hypothetical protein
MECKVCDRVISNEDYFNGHFDQQCNPTTERKTTTMRIVITVLVMSALISGLVMWLIVNGYIPAPW